MADRLVPKAEAKPSYQDLIFELCKPLLAEALPMPPEQAIVTKLGRRIKAQVEVVFAAGRARAAADVRGYAESLRSTAWAVGSGVGAGEIADAAARIAEGSTESDGPIGADVDESMLPASTGGGIHGETPTGGTR